MTFKDVNIDMSNVLADPSKSTVQVVGARPDTDKDLVIVGYRLEICTRRGSRNPVKLPNTEDIKNNIEKIQKLLKKQDFVEVSLKDPVVRPYALISNGNLISGVSIKADSFTIVEPDADDDLLN